MELQRKSFFENTLFFEPSVLLELLIAVLICTIQFEQHWISLHCYLFLNVVYFSTSLEKRISQCIWRKEKCAIFCKEEKIVVENYAFQKETGVILY